MLQVLFFCIMNSLKIDTYTIIYLNCVWLVYHNTMNIYIYIEKLIFQYLILKLFEVCSAKLHQILIYVIACVNTHFGVPYKWKKSEKKREKRKHKNI